MFSYFITGITYKDKKTKNRDTRCFGYLLTFEEAEQAVLNNYCDIYEYIYEYMVIEKIKDGIHQMDFNPTWYKWDIKDECYKKTDKPKFSNGYISWGIG